MRTAHRLSSPDHVAHLQVSLPNESNAIEKQQTRGNCTSKQRTTNAEHRIPHQRFESNPLNTLQFRLPMGIRCKGEKSKTKHIIPPNTSTSSSQKFTPISHVMLHPEPDPEFKDFLGHPLSTHLPNYSPRRLNPTYQDRYCQTSCASSEGYETCHSTLVVWRHSLQRSSVSCRWAA